MKTEILSVAAMDEADRRSIAGGIAGIALMRAAGEAVARLIRDEMPQGRVAVVDGKVTVLGGRVVVLAGPGNNGGDGAIAAELLHSEGWDVRLALWGKPQALKGDAATAWRQWQGETEPATPAILAEADIIVDALFGIGLNREVASEAAELIEAVNRARQGGAQVVSIDIPSGIDGDTGAVMGLAVIADHTVTFLRKKPGHVLMPGRRHAGAVTVADIGIPESAVRDAVLFENVPDLWRAALPRLDPAGHKYDRGHAAVLSGGMSATGAARLAARGALRIGAGLVTVASPEDAVAVNAAHLTAVMLRPVVDVAGFAEFLADERRNAVLIGPGAGVTRRTRLFVVEALAAGKKLVLDADALTVFAEDPENLFTRIAGETVLTPHEGEFGRLFHDLGTGGKIERAREGARRAGAVILLKGPDTVVAAPDGRASITANAPATLATAGSGDVLAGFILGLLAQGMPAFEAASAAAWMHAEAANRFGPGLISEDLSEEVPAVLKTLSIL